MAKYRNDLPQLRGGVFLSDGGMETTLIFHDGIALPHFAAFVLLDSADGRQHLKRYYEPYLAIARRMGAGFILDSATWRANPDWGARLGFDAAGLSAINRASITLLRELREAWEAPGTPCVISGAIGPRGDGYRAGTMAAGQAAAYHGPQIAAFAEAGADLVTAYTLNQVAEAVGIARAAQAHGMPCAISFTVETDGRLASGSTLGDAITAVDQETDAGPAYYLVNCAHPLHFGPALRAGEPWLGRVRGIKANASTKSHAELDESTTLDPGDPQDLGQRYRALTRAFPGMTILGGCCGTDHRHIAAISAACLPAPALSA